MIIVRAPLRITLGGGGTDLPSYYRKHGGYCISAAIDKYVYVSVMRAFHPGIYLKYSHNERVSTPDEIQHPIFREVLKQTAEPDPHLELGTLADIPAGTGLGSSSSFTVALLAAMYAHNGQFYDRYGLAESACHIEIEQLQEPIGRQDQFASVYGGITQFYFDTDGSEGDYVDIQPLKISRETLWSLEDDLLLFYTGQDHVTNSILKVQDDKTKEADAAMIGALHYTKELGFRSKEALEKGDVFTFGLLLHEHWQHKRKRQAGMTNTRIDQLYEIGKENGAVGGKLVGAGGGGFLMFLAEDRAKLRAAMASQGLEECRFHFDFEGVKRIV